MDVAAPGQPGATPMSNFSTKVGTIILSVPPYFGFSAAGAGEEVGGGSGVCVLPGNGAGVGAGSGLETGAGTVAAFGPQEDSTRRVAMKIADIDRNIFVFIRPSLLFFLV